MVFVACCALLVALIILHRRRDAVRFLSAQEAAALFRGPDFDYLKHYRFSESVAKTSGLVSDPVNYRSQVLVAYDQYCLDFTPDEKLAVSGFIAAHPALTSFNWRLVKTDNRMDFGYPYTIGDVVVLPQRMVSRFFDPDVRDVFTTLYHEQIHIMQRYNQPAFDRLYETWGLLKPDRLVLPDTLRDVIVTNPDGPDVRWIFLDVDADTAHFFVLELRPTDATPQKRAYVAHDVGNGTWQVDDDTESVPVEAFARHFWNVSGCYHPNETFAYRVSQTVAKSYFGYGEYSTKPI